MHQLIIMTAVSDSDFDIAVDIVVESLANVTSMYASQIEVLRNLVKQQNIFLTLPTNAGKTLPPVILPSVIQELNKLGYHQFPSVPRVLFITALNSIQLSLVASMGSLGIQCASITGQNAEEVLESSVGVVFIGPETLRLPVVTKALLKRRESFVCKCIDEAHLGKSVMNKKCS